MTIYPSCARCRRVVPVVVTHRAFDVMKPKDRDAAIQRHADEHHDCPKRERVA